MVVKVARGAAAHGMVTPRIEDKEAITTIVALFGAATSPYLFSGRPRGKPTKSRKAKPCR